MFYIIIYLSSILLAFNYKYKIKIKIKKNTYIKNSS